MSQPSNKIMFDDLNEDSVCKIAQAVAHALKDNTQGESDDSPRANKSKERIGATFVNIKLLGMGTPKLRDLIRLAGVYTQAAAA